MKVRVLNGPNLARLDLRSSTIYGDMNFAALTDLVVKAGEDLGFEIEMLQSDSEVEIIHWIHQAADANTPVIINPAAFTHYSYAIRDALEMLKAPKIEVHLSNTMAREEFRHTSVVSGVVHGTIAGFGPDSYRLALIALKNLLSK